MNHRIIREMMRYFQDDVRRINHALKVSGFAATIAGREGVLEQDATVIGLAAALHDIGIKKAEEKYHSTAGKYQEIEGLPTCQANSAKKRHYGINERIIERACFLIG
jgi:HD superfamily phosphodiesterase